MDDKEYSNIYMIPANYTDSGKLFGGLLEVRNTIETAFLLLLFGYPQLFWIPMSAGVKIVVMTITLLPLGAAGLIGVGGDSLLRFAANMAVFYARRRKLHLRRIGYRYENCKKKAPRKALSSPKMRTPSRLRSCICSSTGSPAWTNRFPHGWTALWWTL